MTLDEYQDKIANDDRIVAFYPFAPEFGAKADDMSRFQNHAPITGAVYGGNRGAGSLKFDGVDDGISFGTAPTQTDLQTGFTLSAWCNLTDAPDIPTPNYIVIRGTVGATSYQYSLFCHQAGDFWRVIVGNGTTLGVTPNVAGIELKTGWHRITATYDNAAIRMYQDGAHIAAADTAYAGPLQSKTEMTIGRSNVGNFFKGEMTDVQIYNAALRGDEVRSIYEDSLNFYGVS